MPTAEHPTQRHQAPPPAGGGGFCRRHGAQRQLATACTVGRITGPHAHFPRAKQEEARGPGRTPQGRTVWGGRVPNIEHILRRQEAPPFPGHPAAAPTACRASLQERALWGW